MASYLSSSGQTPGRSFISVTYRSAVVFYVIIYMQPVSLHDDTPLSDRWLSGKFDGGRFDLLQCDKPSFVIPPPVD